MSLAAILAAPRRRLARRRGIALVELAILLPVLAAIVVGMLDFGLAVHRQMMIGGAVRAGLDYLARFGLAESVTTVVTDAAGPDARDLVVSNSRFCECAGVSVVCGATLCPDGRAQEVYVTVTARETYYPLFIHHTLITSALGSARTLNASGTYRIQ